MLDNFSFTLDNYNKKFEPRFRKLAHYGRFQFYQLFYWHIKGMLYERFQLLLLLQSGFNQLLSESLIEYLLTPNEKSFSFVYFLQIEGYGQYYFQKELVVDPSAERFKTAGLRKFSWWTLLVYTAICLNDRRPRTGCSTKWSSHHTFHRSA